MVPVLVQHLFSTPPEPAQVVQHLVVGDLVYFLKKDSKLASQWILGMVVEVSKGRDGVLREVTVKYCNSSEQRLSLTGESSKDKALL